MSGSLSILMSGSLSDTSAMPSHPSVRLSSFLYNSSLWKRKRGGAVTATEWTGQFPEWELWVWSVHSSRLILTLNLEG